MSRAFASQPLIAALFACTLLVWIASEAVQALRNRPNASAGDRYSLLLLRACITASVLLAVWSMRVTTTSFPETLPVFFVALLLLWCGIATRWWCFRTLGNYFTFRVMTTADQPVIDTGPYHVLRHPSYAGLLLALLGIGLTFGNWLSLTALLVLPLAALLYRIHVEEAALARTLGSSYATYAATRKRLIPFVW
jgi:protein-S-isoprenylcysteine O-methyltransferase Ste14